MLAEESGGDYVLPFEHPTPRLVLARRVAAAGRVYRAAGPTLGRRVRAAAVEVYPVVRVDRVARYALRSVKVGERARWRLAKCMRDEQILRELSARCR